MVFQANFQSKALFTAGRENLGTMLEKRGTFEVFLVFWYKHHILVDKI